MPDFEEFTCVRCDVRAIRDVYHWHAGRHYCDSCWTASRPVLTVELAGKIADAVEMEIMRACRVEGEFPYLVGTILRVRDGEAKGESDV